MRVSRLLFSVLLPTLLAVAAATAAADSSENVAYYGGPVVANAHVIAVFWGSGFTAPLQTQLQGFYQAIVNSNFIDQLAEYDTNVTAANGQPGTNQKIGRGTYGGQVNIQPIHTGTQLTTADIEGELEAQLKAGNLPPNDANTVYMLHFPSSISINISFGLSCSDWYADHEVYRSPTFGNVFYAMFPCDSTDTSAFDNLTSAASHELAETITDPLSPLDNQPAAFPAGWLRADGQEIADLCEGTASTLTAGATIYTVQGVWLNSLGACNTAVFKAQRKSRAF